MIKRNKPAFTLTELMIAMALFSFVLLFAVTAFIQINKIYVKGITTKHMNDQANAIIEDLSKNLQQEQTPIMCSASDASSGNCNSDGITTTSRETDYLCLPTQNISYFWTIGSAGSFQKVTGNKCDKTASTKNSQNLVDSNTQVVALNIKPVTIGDNSAWNINLVLSTQRSEQLTDTDPNSTTTNPLPDNPLPDNPLFTRCKGTISDQYCSVVHLTTLIRVGN